jgi:hypothetical protein
MHGIYVFVRVGTSLEVTFVASPAVAHLNPPHAHIVLLNNLSLNNLHIVAAPPPPIPLPPQIHQPAFIPLPPPPAHPPTPADYAHALDYVKQVDAAKGDRLFMCLHKRYTQDVIAAAGGATNVQLQEAYRYLSLVDAAVNLTGVSAVHSYCNLMYDHSVTASLQLPVVQVGLQAALQAVLPAALQVALAELYIIGAQVSTSFLT